MVISPSTSPYRTALSHEGRRNAAGSAGDLATSFWRYLPNVSCTATSRSLADLVRHIARSTRSTSWSMSGSSRCDSQSAVSLQDPVVRVEACAVQLGTEEAWVQRALGAVVRRCQGLARPRRGGVTVQGGCQGIGMNSEQDRDVSMHDRADCSAGPPCVG